MLREYSKKKKEQYIIEIVELIKNNHLENKYQFVRNKLNAYFLYCYKHNLDPYNTAFSKNNIQDLSHIIESTPDLVNIDTQSVSNALDHLKEVQENNRNGLIDGISLKEADIILEYNIQLTRKNLIEYINERNARYPDKSVEDICTFSFDGVCGFVQSLELIPLKELGLEITINNTNQFPTIENDEGHAFGTTIIPIKEQNEVYLNPYLIDASYRQFFSTLKCTEGNFYNAMPNKKDKVGPEAGYYVCLTEEGKRFAEILTKRGFIEWTPKNAKIYGDGFTCASKITLKNLQDYHKIKKTLGEVYYNSVRECQVQLEFDKEELETDGFILDLETETLKR